MEFIYIIRYSQKLGETRRFSEIDSEILRNLLVTRNSYIRYSEKSGETRHFSEVDSESLRNSLISRDSHMRYYEERITCDLKIR